MQNLDNVVHICYEQIRCAEATVTSQKLISGCILITCPNFMIACCKLSTGIVQVDFQDFYDTCLIQVILTTCSKLEKSGLVKSDVFTDVMPLLPKTAIKPGHLTSNLWCYVY